MSRALWMVLCVGCANPAKMEPKPHLDFGLDEEKPDLAASDLAVTVDVDLAHTMMNDLGSADLVGPSDLLPPPSCDDAGTTGHLFLAAVGAANVLLTSRFAEGAGWTAYQSISSATDVAQTLVAARPYVVVRQSNAKLAETAADPCSQAIGTLAPIGTETTAMRPSLLPTDLVFRGNSGGDLHLYYMARNGSTWQAAVQQTTMSTATPFALVRFDGAPRVYYLDAGKLMEGLPGAGGGTSAQVLSEMAGQPPVAVVDGAGNLNVVYVGTDTNVHWVWKASGGSFTHHQLCDGQSGCLDDTNLPVALALDSTGVPMVAWAGKDKKVYSARLLTTAGPQFWGAAALASGSCGTKDCQTTVGPALATGIGSMSVELVFVSDLDGRARHARFSGTTWGEPVSIVGTNLLNTPALVAEP